MSYIKYTEQEIINKLNNTVNKSAQEIINDLNGTVGKSLQEILTSNAGVAPYSQTVQELIFNNVKTALSLTGHYTTHSTQELLNRAYNSNMTLEEIFSFSVNNYLSFNGTSNAVTRAAQSVYNNTNYWLSFWIKGSAQSDARFYSEGGGNATVYMGIGSGTSAGTGKLKLNIRNDANSTIANLTSTQTVLDGTWHHIILTDENGTATLYVDGTSESLDYTKTGVFTLTKTTIGALGRNTTANYFNGSIDSFYAGVGTLSSDDRVALRNGIYNPSSAYFAYKFDEGSGTSATDSSGNSRTGTHNCTYVEGAVS